MLVYFQLFFLLCVFGEISAIGQCNFPKGKSKHLTMKCDDIINFAVVGDWGVKKESSVTRSIVKHIQQKAGQYDFIVAAGDNFYSSGVTSTEDRQWKRTWYKRFQVSKMNLPWFAILGNHDYRGNIDAQVDYTYGNFDGSKYWFMPHRYYSVSVKTKGSQQLELFFLDLENFSNSERRWLEKESKSSKKKLKLAFGHQQIFSYGKRGDSDKKGVLRAQSILEKNGFIAYIGGHEHDMQYMTYRNMDYFLVGGGGAKLRSGSSGSKAKKIYWRKAHGYSTHEIDILQHTLTTTLHLFDKKGRQLGSKVFIRRY